MPGTATGNAIQGAILPSTTPSGAAGGALSGTYPNPGLASPLPGNVELAAGTTVLAPLTFQSGTNLTTATAGDLEFDGTAFYATAAASSRQVVDTEQIQVLSGTYTLANDTNPHPLLNATAAGALTVQGLTTYEFECMFAISSLSGSSHTVSFGLAVGGSLTSIFYTAVTGGGGGGAASLFQFATAAASVIIAATTTTTMTAIIKGIMRVNGGGTITPQVTQGTAAAAAVVAANSFFRCWPIGSNAVTNVGDWS